MKLIKDGMIMELSDWSTYKLYKSYGWQEVTEEEKPVEVVEPTKKELQAQLDKLGIKYKPIDNKALLQEKLTSAEPANDFDDGLLKE